METLHRFPEVDGIVLRAVVGKEIVQGIIADLKAIDPQMPVILTAATPYADSLGADYVVPSFEPGRLLETLRMLCGENAESLQRHEALLESA
jgi:hypothetical protein